MSGLLFGWYFTFSCYKFSKDAAQDTMTGIFLGTAVLFFVVGIVHQACDMQLAAAKTLWCGSGRVGGVWWWWWWGDCFDKGLTATHRGVRWGAASIVSKLQLDHCSGAIPPRPSIHPPTPHCPAPPNHPQGQYRRRRPGAVLHGAADDDGQGHQDARQRLAQRAAQVRAAGGGFCSCVLRVLLLQPPPPPLTHLPSPPHP
jgi:hypothetical protein